MYNFTDLIAKSYLKYTKEKDDNIAVYFFQQYQLINYEGKFIFPKNLYYTDLIKKLDGFIKNTIHNTHFTRRDLYSDTGIMDNEVFEKIQKFGLIEYQRVIEAEVFEEFQKKRLLEHQNLIDDSGVDYIVKRVNYEESTNAKELEEAFDYGLDLKDPVKIITPSTTIQDKDLVLRKSKLEYIKTEAIRASKANSINELDNNDCTTSVSINPNNSSNTFSKVSKAFMFTLTKDPTQNKQMLSQQDYNNLVIWVTEYFDHSFKVPEINDNERIKQINTAKGNIVQAFKDLFAKLEPRLSKRKPISYFELISSCFVLFYDDNRKQIDGTKPSKDYDNMIKETP